MRNKKLKKNQQNNKLLKNTFHGCNIFSNRKIYNLSISF